MDENLVDKIGKWVLLNVVIICATVVVTTWLSH